MDTRFVADLETLLEVLCEHWNIKREDLRFAYDGSFHKSDDLQDGEIEVDINNMFKIFDNNSRMRLLRG